jgi:hypothetical protein
MRGPASPAGPPPVTEVLRVRGRHGKALSGTSSRGRNAAAPDFPPATPFRSTLGRARWQACRLRTVSPLVCLSYPSCPLSLMTREISWPEHLMTCRRRNRTSRRTRPVSRRRCNGGRHTCTMQRLACPRSRLVLCASPLPEAAREDEDPQRGRAAPDPCGAPAPRTGGLGCATGGLSGRCAASSGAELPCRRQHARVTVTRPASSSPGLFQVSLPLRGLRRRV